MTYKQAAALGAQVRKGEHGSLVATLGSGSRERRIALRNPERRGPVNAEFSSQP